MERADALFEIKSRLFNENLIKHSLAVEAIMRELARYFGEDTELWGLAGLLHDIDYEKTAKDPSKHSIIGADILENLGINSSVVYAVRAHNDYHNIPRRRKIDIALFSADPLSGLIVATVLIIPSKKIKDINSEFIINRMNEKGFARGANREQIMNCTKLGIELIDFIEISLKAMQKNANQLGL